MRGINPLVLAQTVAVEAFVIMNSVLLGIRHGRCGQHGVDLLLDVVNIRARVNPHAVQVAAVIGGKVGNVDSGFSGHGFDLL
ncbi:hypothetical protein D3C85_1440390 [compost metagenome]